MEQLVALITLGALEVLHVKTSLNLTVVSLESEVREAVSALSSLVSDASSLHPLANTLTGKEVATFTSNTLVVVVGLAVLNGAVSIFQLEGAVAFLANMLNFILASQDGVHDADVVVEGVSLSTVRTGLFFFIGEFNAILNGHNATTSFEEET